MKRVFPILVIAGITYNYGYAATLMDVTKHSYNGVVQDLTKFGVKFFLIQKAKQEIDEDAFKAQAYVFSPRIFPYSDVQAIDNIPIKTFALLYLNNPMFKLKYKLEYAWAMNVQKGTFVQQLKAVAVFLMLLGLLVPYGTYFGGKVFGSTVGFMGSLGITLLIYGGATAMIYAFVWLADSDIQFFHHASGQVIALIGMLLIFAFVIAGAYRQGIAGAIGMMGGWLAGLYGVIFLLKFL